MLSLNEVLLENNYTLSSRGFYDRLKNDKGEAITITPSVVHYYYAKNPKKDMVHSLRKSIGLLGTLPITIGGAMLANKYLDLTANQMLWTKLIGGAAVSGLAYYLANKKNKKEMYIDIARNPYKYKVK